MSPRFRGSLRLRRGDHVRSRLLDHSEPIEFQLTNNSRFPRARRPGDHESSHLTRIFRQYDKYNRIQVVTRARGEQQPDNSAADHTAETRTLSHRQVNTL